MALSEQQIQQLNAQCNKLPIAKLIEYIDKGFVRFPEDLSALSEDRKQAIATMLNSRPNPQEQADWRAVVNATHNLSTASVDELRSHIAAVKNYQDKWGVNRPVNNHVDEAPALIDRIKDEIKARMKDIEEGDWQTVDHDSVESLMAHLTKYPDTCHFDEIDNRVWTLLKQMFEAIEAANRYLAFFPAGACKTEAQEIKQTYDEWDAVKQQYDLIATREYIKAHPLSPFGDEAEELFQMLKADEIQGMTELQGNYPIENLLYYLDNGIFTEDELIDKGVATRESIDILKNIERIKGGLPDVNAEISKCRKVCADGHTDVFLFGIPSTGKTCILMGLIGCTDIDIDTVRAGGPYSTVLDQYLTAGLTIGQTPKDFVATIEAEIMEGNKKHLLNLVEMSGEDFAFKIADNENGKISFEDMGNGATRLLCNNNRKVFFIIVDPTARVVAFNHLVEDQDGSYLIRKNVNQRVILKRMVDLLRQPENRDILKKVEAINIIVTKSDTLGNEEERDQKALEHFKTQYGNIIAPLTALCQQYNINQDNGGRPKLYSFSLGQFYVGGIYKYNDRDAKKLVQVLKRTTETYKSGGFSEAFKKVFN